MTRRRLGFWDYAFIALLAIAVPAGIFHLVQDRPAQALMALIAIIAGGVVLVTGLSRPAPQAQRPAAAAVTPRERPAAAERDQAARPRAGRLDDWLPLSAVSGFAATGIMSGLLVIAYLISAALGSTAPGAPILQQWMQALVDNTLAEAARANLAVALVSHFLAGVAWAVIYAGFVEPRLSGPGWRRGVIFSLIPWALSVLVFFPLSGAGLLGFGLEAGPLPIIGNLILHLAYGAVLGEVYASSRLTTESGQPSNEVELGTLARAQRLMAAGIVPGLVFGGILGALASSIIAPGADVLIVAVIGAITGSVVGVLIGSFFGLSPASSEPASSEQ